MKLFITGGAGFIGSNFIRFLLSGRDYHVVNYDALTYAGNLCNLESVSQDARYRFIKGNICDAAAVQDAMQGCEAVVHFAAESHVDRSIYEPGPVVETNISGTFVLLKVARQLKVSRFVHVSTDEVYGDLAPGTFADENSPLLPNSPYSAAKASSDLLVRSYVRTYGLPAVITRASNNYGPYQFPEKFLPLIISNALEHKPLPIYGDGRQQRDWLHVDDHCRALLAVLERGRDGEVYNIGGGNVEQNLTLARRLLHITGKPETLLQFVADRPGHDRRYALNSSKISTELGWRPEVALDDGLRRTVEWYRANQSWLDGVRSGAYREYYDRHYTRREATLREIAGAAEAAG
jgi:dTDP-glucose 4,6-dehydratase